MVLLSYRNFSNFRPPEISDNVIRSLHHSCDAKSVIPLTRVINAPDRVAPAVRQVFGRFLLIQNNGTFRCCSVVISCNLHQTF